MGVAPPSVTRSRRVEIGDAAGFAGTTPRAIRNYHEIGLLPEPERGAAGRRYGYDDMIRILGGPGGRDRTSARGCPAPADGGQPTGLLVTDRLGQPLPSDLRASEGLHGAHDTRFLAEAPSADS